MLHGGRQVGMNTEPMTTGMPQIQPGKNTPGTAGCQKLKMQPGGKRPENKNSAGRQRHNVNRVNVKVNVNKVNDKVNDMYSIHSHYKVMFASLLYKEHKQRVEPNMLSNWVDIGAYYVAKTAMRRHKRAVCKTVGLCVCLRQPLGKSTCVTITPRCFPIAFIRFIRTRCVLACVRDVCVSSHACMHACKCDPISLVEKNVC